MLGSWIAAALRSATPLLIVMLGETLTQRTGVINLGVEGEMLMGACVGFAVAATTGEPDAGPPRRRACRRPAVDGSRRPRARRKSQPDRIGPRGMDDRPRADLLFRPLLRRRAGFAVPAARHARSERAGLHSRHPRSDHLDRARGTRIGRHRRRLALPHPHRTELADRRQIRRGRKSAGHSFDMGALAGHPGRRIAGGPRRGNSLGRLYPDLGAGHHQRARDWWRSAW